MDGTRETGPSTCLLSPAAAVARWQKKSRHNLPTLHSKTPMQEGVHGNAS